MKLAIKKQNWLIIGIFFAVAILVYGSSLSNEFVNYDDTRLIVENPLIRNIDPASWWRIFTSYEEVLYTPLLFLSYQIDYALVGLDSWLYHAHSLLLHTMTALLVSLLMGMLTGKKKLSMIAGLLFLVQPLNTELVTWASLRKDLLAGLFGVSTLLSYVHAQSTQNKRWYLGSIGLFALALLSKPSVITLPCVLPIIDALQGRRPQMQKLGYVPFVVLAACILMVNSVNANQALQTMQFSIAENILLSFKSTAALLFWFIVPIKHSVIHPVTDAVSLSNPHFALSIVFVLVLFGTAWFIRKKQPVYLYGLTVFWVLLVPTFRTFRFGENFGDIYFTGERYAYLPMLGLLLIVIHLLSKVWEKFGQKPVLIAATIVLCIYAGVSHAQASVWRNTKTLFKHVVREYPNAQMAHNNLGTIYENEGLHDLAIQSYEKALAIRPTGQVYANLGQALSNAGRLEEAIVAFEKSLEFNPLNAPVQLNIGVAHFKLEQIDEAVTAFMLSAELDVHSPIPWVNIGVAEEYRGNIPQAIIAYKRAIELAPNQTAIQKKLEKLEQESK